MLGEKEQKETYKCKILHSQCYENKFLLSVLTDKIKKMMQNEIKGGFEDHSIFR